MYLYKVDIKMYLPKDINVSNNKDTEAIFGFPRMDIPEISSTPYLLSYRGLR